MFNWIKIQINHLVATKFTFSPILAPKKTVTHKFEEMNIFLNGSCLNNNWLRSAANHLRSDNLDISINQSYRFSINQLFNSIVTQACASLLKSIMHPCCYQYSPLVQDDELEDKTSFFAGELSFIRMRRNLPWCPLSFFSQSFVNIVFVYL